MYYNTYFVKKNIQDILSGVPRYLRINHELR